MPNFIMTPLISFFGALTGSSVAATVLAHITVAGVSMVGANLLMPKVDFGQAQTRQSLNVRGRNQRNATTNRQYIYGQVKVGGTVAYMGVTDTDNKFLHMVLVHCDHEVEELGDLYVNGELVPMVSGGEGVLRTTDTSSTFGTSLADRYNGSLYIADHLGGPNQTTADSTLNNATGDIGSSDAFKGMAYTYIRMELKQGEENAFPSGIPQFQRVIKGMKVYDPRESGHDPDDSTTWEYSSNWALCVAHFLQSDFGYGRYGLNYDKINESELIASANNSDDSINELWKAWQANETLETGGFTRSLGGFLLYSGTTTGTTGATAPNLTGLGVDDTVVDNDITWTLSYDDINTGTRYELNGMVDSHEDPIEVLRKMKTAASGMIEYIGGEWFVRSGRYIAPTVTLSESDFVTGISGTTKDDRTNAVNTVKGVIVDKHDFYNVIDAPSVTNSTFVTQDGGVESVKEMELLFTNSHKAAQRLFKIDLNKSRQSISHKASFTSKAMQLQVGDNFYLNFAKYGYSNKLFQVWSHQLVINEGALQVEMEFRETATNVYDWDHTTDETALDPAPNTNLPDPFEVTAPTGMTATSGTDQLIEASDGTVLPTVLLTWTESASVNVIGYQIRWKYANDSNDTQYRYITVNGKNNTSSVITGVKESRGNANHYIDIDIRSLTSVKAGEWTVVEHDHNVLGKSEAPTDPSGPTVSAVENGVTVTFSEHPDLDFFNYHIWVQTSSSPPTHTGTGPFSPLATTSTSGLTKTILGLDPSTTYYVFTAAMDSSRLFSDIVATTPATISPSAIAAGDVTGLGALATEDSIDLGTEGNGGVTTGTVLPVGNTEATDNGATIDTSGNVNAAIDFTDSGAIKHGKTSSDDASNAGFWLGQDGQATPDYDFHIGDSSNSLKWDGSASTLTVKGDLTAGSVDIGSGLQRTQIDSNGTSSWGSGRIQINASDSFFGDVGQKWLGSPIESIWIDCNTTTLPARLYFGNTNTGATNAFITGQGNAEFKTLDVTTSLDLNSSTLDASNGVGTSGQILSSTGTATQWIDSAANLWTQSGSDIYYNSGDVAIGSTSASAKLDVRNDGADVSLLRLSGNHGSGVVRDMFVKSPVDSNTNSPYRFTTSNSFSWEIDGTEQVRLDHAGNVGIGDSTPSYKLDVNGTSRFVSTARFDANTANYGGAYDIYRSGAGYLRHRIAGQSLNIGVTSSGGSLYYPIIIDAINGAVTMKGDSGGANIELYGASHSSYANDAYIDANMLTVRNAAGSTTIAEFDSSEVDIKNRLKVDLPSDAWTTSSSWYSVSDGNTNEYGSLTTSGSFAVTLNGNGYRKSGTASTSWVSHEANGNTGATQIWQYPAGYITFNANTSWATGSSNTVTERMRIFGDGNVSIGTTSSGYKLRVNGTGFFDDSVTLGSYGSEGGELRILDTASSTAQAAYVDIDSQNNARFFQVGNGDLMLGNLTGGTGETKIYCNADLKIDVKSTQTEITDQLYVSGHTGGDSIVTINGIDCGGGMLVQGSLDVDGNLDVGLTKNFRIAHPVRDGHDLRHTCVESPQADLTYRGQATLVDGTVQVDLDSEFGMTAGTFAALNDDVQVFVQNESGWDSVRGSVNEGVLTINCEDLDSTDSVGWLVIGRRTGVELEIEPETKIK